MCRVVTAIGGAVSLPLQIDSSNPKAIEAGLRAAPGKCLVNSVNASRTSLETVLPIAKKYGAAIVGLALGENGLPTTSEERLGFARTILNAALEAGIAREDVAIDCLTLTVSAQQDQVKQTLEAVRPCAQRNGAGNGAGRVQHFLRPAAENACHAGVFDAGHSKRTDPADHQSQSKGHDGCGGCVPRCSAAKTRIARPILSGTRRQIKPQTGIQTGAKLSI